MSGIISFDGLATGIKSSETVDKIMEVEARPKTLKEAEKARLQNQVTAWQNIDSRLLELRQRAKDLWSASAWNTLSAKSSDETVLKATASASARAGTYTLEVSKLALNHMVASNGYASALSTVGTGTLTVGAGAASKTITVDASNNTLAGIAQAINAAGAGVTASVINDGTEGTGYKLLLSSDATGTANDVSASASGLTLSFPTTVQDSQDAQLKFGTMTITSASNTVTGVIDGVTLNLLTQKPDAKITVSVSRETAGVEDSIQSFVDAYNGAMGFIGSQFLFDAKSNTGGILMGDQALVSIQSRIQGMLTSSVATGGTHRSLQSIGLSLEDDGTLAFDKTKFAAAVAKDAASVEKLFRTTGTVSHAKIRFLYAGKKAAESTGGYAVDITRAATRTTRTGGADVGSLTIDGANDSLQLALDGGTSFSVSLTHKTYASLSDLAEELRAKINAAATGGAQVTVGVEGNRITLTSGRYGSGSKVEILAGTGLANLGLTESTLSAGVDVAGTINGEPATGSGQILTGDSGNARTDGVQLEVGLAPEDLVSGAEGSLTITKGVAARFNEYLMDLTDPLTGSIETRRAGLERSIGDLDTQMAEMQKRLDQKRESLLEMFRRMEESVSKLNSQGNYLANAIAGLNANWSN